ncbi:hypothetical protein [Aquimarina longa]|uniref:hypothetical protein n=1 Tax=Aquimarina longa TaxID=1080221 RepID=UPI000B10D6EC|nr:hypothetical protein [Aquimarina longa]
MLVDDIDEVPQEVLFGILKFLNIDTNNFMNNLLNHDPYCVSVYTWIYARYHENKISDN